MASSPIVALLLFLILCRLSPSADSSCSGSVCAASEPLVRFPFRLKYVQDERCGYTGFDLSCNNKNRTIITLPFSGNFLVSIINYHEDILILKDPDDCMARRLLDGFNSNGSSFIGEYYRNFTFFNCSPSIPEASIVYEQIPCLSTSDYSITIVPDDHIPPDVELSLWCSNNWTVTIPVPWPSWSAVAESIWLKWDGTPICEYCHEHRESCKFWYDRDNICSHPKHGIAKGAEMGIFLGLASPWFLCLLGISCYLSSKNNRQPNAQPSPSPLSTDQHPRPGDMGMDGPAIELYPKIEVGDSGQLPRPSDNTCSICLLEYQIKDILRTISDCNHYFHAHCIDPWLKQNGSCPLCRNRQD